MGGAPYDDHVPSGCLAVINRPACDERNMAIHGIVELACNGMLGLSRAYSCQQSTCCSAHTAACFCGGAAACPMCHCGVNITSVNSLPAVQLTPPLVFVAARPP